MRGERSPPAAMEEAAAERGRAGAGAAAMAEGGSTAGGEDNASDNDNASATAATAASSAPPRSPPEGGGAKPLSAAEYARRVHQWLWDSYCGYLGWQGCPPALIAAAAQPPPPNANAAAYYYSPFYLFAPPPAHAAPAGTGPRAPGAAAPAWPGAAGAVSPVPRAGSGSATGSSGSAAPRDTGRPAGREFLIPSLAHRFIAEMVDFFILFFIKATIILSIMHLSGIKDISKFAMHYIIEEIDEDTSMEDLQKMMIVALIYRLLVCFYEIICIWGAGGATPGKFLLGLRVVTCDTSVLIAPSRVLVIPSSNVSMTTSTVRALIKNFSIASFFPAFITLLFFQHNRTAYDIVAGTIVVRRNGVR
ncbi:protein FAM8A1 [Pipra filicauda]|uniref:Protein FAM8A1 n=1 Tax=Pipra filicauda TaxID=649802 RepID=A0A6J2IN67_9PASS|nr:protein FAM8A1 [Pipra filicauda]